MTDAPAPREITDSDKLRKLTWAIRAYSRSVAALSRSESVETLAQEICASIANENYVLVWIGVAEQDSGKSFRLIARAGSAVAYADDLELSWDGERPEGQGPTGIAVRTGQTQVMYDRDNDPRFLEWRERAKQCGIRSSVTVPFADESRIIGAMMVYACEACAFGPQEIELFEDLGKQLGNAFRAAARNDRLRLSEAKYSKLIAATPTPILGVDAHSNVQLFNEAAEKVFLYRAPEIIGQPLRLLIPEVARSAHDRLVSEYAANGEGSRRMAPIRTLVGVRKNGASFPVEVTISKVDTNDGPLMTAIIRDLTEEKAMQARLVQSEKMDALGQMASGISHDFNNLLSVVRGGAQILRDAGLPSGEAKRSLEMIEHACARGSDLTRQLLIFSRKATPNPQVVDANAVVKDVADILKRTLHGEIVVSIHLPEPPALIFVEPSLLQSSLLNLAFNARDAMPSGGKILFAVAKVESGVSASKFVQIKVKDTGTGISAEILPKVFEPFFTTKPHGKGTGLGLAMVKTFVRQCGGDIEVSSGAGSGTVFSLVFPAVESHQFSTQLEGETQEPKLGGLKVLYVEDDGDVRAVHTIILERAGAHVTAVSTAPEALRESETHGRFDVLLTDHWLGSAISGVALAKELQARQPQLRIVVMSGNLDLEELDIVNPSWVVLRKPAERASLLRAIVGPVT